MVDDRGLDDHALVELLLHAAPLALEAGATQRQDRVALLRLRLEHVDEDRVADAQLGLRLGVAAVELPIADDALGLRPDVDEHLVLVDADDRALDDVAVLEAPDLARLLVEQLLHRRRLGAVIDRAGGSATATRRPMPRPARRRASRGRGSAASAARRRLGGHGGCLGGRLGAAATRCLGRSRPLSAATAARPRRSTRRRGSPPMPRSARRRRRGHWSDCLGRLDVASAATAVPRRSRRRRRPRRRRRLVRRGLGRSAASAWSPRRRSTPSLTAASLTLCCGLHGGGLLGRRARSGARRPPPPRAPRGAGVGGPRGVAVLFGGLSRLRLFDGQ